MDLRKIFPHAMGARDLKGLIIAIVIYAVVSFVGGIIHGLVGGIPLVGMVIGVIGWLLGIYCTVGIIISILVFFKVVK
jgi:hypothetical protein